MTKVIANITTSLDGYVAGPNDRPGLGLGEGGERLHAWMFGDASLGEPTSVDVDYSYAVRAEQGAVIGGRRMYDLAEAWGGANPFAVPFFVVTHRPEDQPASGEFIFVGGVAEALRQAAAAAGNRPVAFVGGASIVGQALIAGLVDELWLSVAPVLLGGGKRLFDGVGGDLALQPIRVLASPLATHITYRVGR